MNSTSAIAAPTANRLRTCLAACFLPFLAGCTSVPLADLVEPTTNIISSLAAGNNTGALGQGLDVLLMLLGLKGVKAGARVAKKQLGSNVTNITNVTEAPA